MGKITPVLPSFLLGLSQASDGAGNTKRLYRLCSAKGIKRSFYLPSRISVSPTFKSIECLHLRSAGNKFEEGMGKTLKNEAL